jgi:hypothetical protein
MTATAKKWTNGSSHDMWKAKPYSPRDGRHKGQHDTQVANRQHSMKSRRQLVRLSPIGGALSVVHSVSHSDETD